ncbi:putative Ig domain-containing protein [bacterium]|nr:putative Ig domain-containing protein [bacterium]
MSVFANTAPYFTAAVEDTNLTEDAYWSAWLSAADDDADAFTFAFAAAAPEGMTINATSGRITWTPDNDDVGTHRIQVSVSDSSLIDYMDFFLHVQNLNDPPFWVNTTEDTVSVSEDSELDITVTANDDDLPHGDHITYLITRGENVIVNSSTGSISGSPDNSNVGFQTVTVRARDDSSAAVEWSFVLETSNTDVVFTNTPPTEINEDDYFGFDLSSNDEGQGNTVYYFQTGFQPEWMGIAVPTGIINGTPNNEYVGTETVKIIVDDDNGSTDTLSYDLSVVNRKPIITTSTLHSATEGAGFALDINADDEGLGTTSYRFLDDIQVHPTWLGLSTNSGVVSGTPTNAHVGSNSFYLEFDDGNGGKDTTQFVINVANDPVQIDTTNLVYDISEDQEYYYKFTSNDDGQGTITYHGVGLPGWLTINLYTGILRGTPNNENVDDFNISVYVSDGTDTDTVSYTIHVENRVPQLESSEVDSVNEDSEYTYDINYDDEGEGVVYRWLIHPSWLSLNASTGELTGTPDNSNVGDTTVSVQVNDGNGGIISHTFSIAVINRDPEFTPQTDITIAQDVLLTIDLDTDDEDDPLVTYGILSAPIGVGSSVNSGIFTWTPTNAQIGDHEFSISCTDNHGGTSTITFTVTATNLNPEISSSPPTTATENTAYQYDVQSNEEGIGNVTYSLTTAPDWLSINASTGLIQGTPGNPNVGDHDVVVRVDDGNGGVYTQSWTITVSNTNPTIITEVLDPATEDSAYSFQIDYIPINEGDHTFAIHGDKPAWLSINALNGLLSGTPINSQVGSDSIMVRITDDHGGYGEKRLEIVVNNSLPVFSTTGDVTGTEDEALDWNINTNDEGDEGPNASGYNLVMAPDWMTINSGTGVLSGTPRDNNVTSPTDWVTIRYQDGNNGEEELNITVEVTNDPPKITSLSPTSTATEEVGYSFQFTSDDDAYGYTRYSSLHTLPNNFTLTTAGLLTGTPSNNEVGNQAIGIIVTDKNSGKDTLEYTLTIANAASPITSCAVEISPYTQTADTVYVTEDLPYRIDFTAQDEAIGSPASYTVNHKPAWMTIKSLVNGQLEGTPDNRHVGRDYVDITFSDGNGYSDTKRVYFQIQNVISSFIDPPSSVGATEDVEFTLDLNSSDEGQGTITYSITNGDPGWFTLNSTSGEINGTPDNDDVTDGAAVTFQVIDGNGGTATKTIVFIIENVNDVPTWSFGPLAGAIVSTAEDALYTVDINADDVDVGDNITYSLTVKPTGMTINSSSGVINWTPDNSLVGDHAVTVRAVDDNAAAITRSWTARVTNVASPITTPVVGDFDPPDAVTATVDTFYIKEDTTYSLNLSAPDEGAGAGEDVLYGFGAFPNPDWVMLTNAVTGIISLTPTNNDVGLDSFKVFFKDQPGSRDTATIYLDVVNVPAEILTAGPFTATEGDAFLDTLESSDDGDGTITWSFVSGKPGWLSIEAASGKIYGTPGNDDVLSDASFTVLVNDGNGGLTQKSFDYSVKNFNTAPSITAVPTGTVATNEDALYTTDINATDNDVGDVLTYSLQTAPAGMTINASTGVIQWTPSNGQVGTHTVTVKVTDSVLEFVTASWQVQVNNLNDAPTWVSVPSGTIDIDEDVLYTVVVEAADIDAGDNLTYSFTENPAGMTIDANSGLIEWTPDNDDVSLHVITVKVTDASLANISASWTLSVQNVNDAPTWSSVPTGTVSSAEDANYTVDVDASDVDAGDVITYSLTQKPTGMTINSSTGVISWTPNNSNVGNHTVTLKSTDLSGGFVSQSYTLQVTNVASAIIAPVVGDFSPSAAVVATVDTFYIKEDTSYTLNLSSPDESVGASSIYSFDDFPNPDWVTLSNATTGIVAMSPTNGDVGLDSFQVYFRDQPGSRDTITIYLRVENVVPEIMTDGPFAATEGIEFSQQLESSDDGDGTITWSFKSGKPAWLSIDISTGLLTGTPANNNVVTDASFVIEVNDGNGGTAEKTFDYSVINVNNEPVLTVVPVGVITTAEDAIYITDIDATDSDVGDVITYSLTVKPTGMTINSSTGVISWTPNNSNVGNHTVTLKATDLSGGFVSQSYTLQVTNVASAIVTPVVGDFSPSDAVTATADTFYIKEDTSYTLNLSSPDESVGASSIYSFDDFPNPDWVSLSNATTGIVTLTPTNGDVGLDSFQVYFKDQPGSRDTIKVYLRVENVVPEILTEGPFTAIEGVAFSQQLESSDDDDGAISWSFVSGKPDWLDIDTNTGLLSGTPSDAHVISDGTFTVKVDDGNSGITQKEFTYSVTNVNNRPFWTSVPSGMVSTNEDSPYSVTVSADDEDLDNGDVISYSLVSPPSSMTINGSTGAISWTPNNSHVGSNSITVKVTDLANASVSSNYTLNVVNTPPTIASLLAGDFEPSGTVTVTVDTFYIWEDSSYTVNFSANDEGLGDGTVYRTVGLSNPDWVTLTNTATGIIQMDPINKDVGLDSFRIVFDDGNATDTSKIYIRVQNSPPLMIAAGPFSATEDETFDVDLESTDEDAFTTYSFVGIYPTWMSINTSSGLITGTPTNDAVGTSTFTVRVNDGHGGTDDHLYTINVANTNDPPIITSSALTTATEDVLYIYDMEATDQDGDPIKFRLVTFPEGMTIDTSSGLIRWTPDNNFGGSTVSVKASVEDTTGFTVNQSWGILVTNAVPNFLTADASFDATEDVEFSADLSVDDEGQGLTSYSVIHLPGWMTLTNSSTGLISGTPDNSYVNSSDSVYIEFSDGNGGKDTLNVPVNVANVAPVFVSQADTIVSEAEAVVIDLNCDDESAGGVTYSALLALPDWLTLNNTTGELSGTPENDDIGVRTVSIRATDAFSGFASVSFQITVQNAAPEFTGIPLSTIEEDSLYEYTPTLSDNSGTNTFQLLTNPGWLSINGSTGKLSGTALNNHVGDNTVSVSVNDGNGVSDTLDYIITVTNSKPLFTTIPTTTGQEDLLYSLNLNCSDEGQGTMIYTALQKPGWLTLNPTSGLLRGTPLNQHVTIGDTVEIMVNDGNGGFDTLGYSLAITNKGPSFTNIFTDTTITEDDVFLFDVNSDDEGQGATAYSFTNTVPDWITLNLSTGVISGTPLNNHVTDFVDIYIQVDDGNGKVKLQTIILSVNNNPTQFTSSITDSIATEDELFIYDANTDDEAQGASVYTITGLPAWLSADDTTGILSGTPTNDDIDTTAITIRFNDGNGSIVEQLIHVIVENANDAPLLTTTTVIDTIDEDSPWSFQFSAMDIDSIYGDSLSFELKEFPAMMQVDSSTGLVFWTPQNADVGDGSFELWVFDKDRASDSLKFILHINNTNDAPVLIAQADTIAKEDELFSYTIRYEDVDVGDSVRFELITSPLLMEIDSLTGLISWTPTNDERELSFEIIYSIRDGIGETDIDTFSLFVENVNDAPVLSALDDDGFAEDGSLTIVFSVWFDKVADIDNPDSTLSWEVISFSTVSAVISNDTLTILGPQNWFGPDTGKVVVSDGELTDTTDLAIFISPVNDPPVIDVSFPTLISFAEDETTIVDLNDYVADVDNYDLEMNWSVIPVDSKKGNSDVVLMNSVLTTKPVLKSNKISPSRAALVNSNGDSITIDIDPATNIATFYAQPNFFIDAYDFRFVVDDSTVPGNFGRDTVITTIQVLPANDPPILALLPELNADEDSTISVILSNWFEFVTDVDNHDTSLTWSVVNGDFTSAVIIDSLLRISPLANWFGDDTLLLIVTDEELLSDTTNIIVHFQSVNDSPVFGSVADLTIPEDDTIFVELNDYVEDVETLDEDLTFTVQRKSTVGKNLSNTLIHTSIKSSIKNEYLFLSEMKSLSSEFSSSNKAAGMDSIRITIDALTHIASISGTPNYNTDFQAFTFYVSDGDSVDSINVNIAIESINDKPVLDSLPTITFQEDSLFVLSISQWDTLVYDVEDADDTLQWSFKMDGLISLIYDTTVNQITLWGGTNFHGSAVLTVIVTDLEGLSDTSSLDITIVPINDPPQIDSSLFTITFDQKDTVEYHLDAYVSDTDHSDQSLSWQFIAGEAVYFNYTDTGRNVRFWSDVDWFGIDSIMAIVTDPMGGSDSQYITITVTDTTRPSFELAIFQNQLASKYVEIDVFPSELLSKNAFIITDGDTLRVQPQLDADSSVYYNTSYQIEKSGIVLIYINGTDRAGNTGDYSYKIGVSKISRETGGALTDPDSIMSFLFAANAVPMDLCAIFLPYKSEIRVDTLALAKGLMSGDDFPVSDEFDFRIPVTKLDDNARIMFSLDRMLFLQQYAADLGIYKWERNNWQYLTTYTSLEKGTYWAYSAKPGIYQIRVNSNNPAVLLPEQISVMQNYPNPFNSQTTIRYTIGAGGFVTFEEAFEELVPFDVSIKVYNILGQEVATLVKKLQLPGFYSVSWNGRNKVGKPVSTGLYIYQVIIGDKVFHKKMTILK